MLQINGLDEGLEIFRTLGSEVRMRIVQLLAANGEMNMNELAEALDLTNGAVTSHVRKLEQSGIIGVKTEPSGRGTQKVCSLLVDQLLFSVHPAEEQDNVKVYETQIGVGLYSDYSVKPGCGLAGAEGLIGPEDDTRSFAYPERIGAELLWFHDGYIEYRIPNLLPDHQQIVQLTLSFEISSADQGIPGDTLSDIGFYLNGRYLGEWKSIPSPDSARGIFTPEKWSRPERQHGFLKMLVLNQMGAFLDGVKISDEFRDSAFVDESGGIVLRFEVHPREGREGGFAIYGEGFGNYKQGIQARIHYMPEEIING